MIEELKPPSPASSESVPEDVFQHILKYAANANSVVTLYDRFLYYKKYRTGTQELIGVISYVDTPTAWIGTTDPFCDESILKEFMVEFVESAKNARKVAVFIPAYKKTAQVARELGYYVIQIGMEPWLTLDQLPATIKDRYLQNMHVAKQLHSKGAVVEKFDPLQITTRERMELDVISAQWLESKKSIPLSFLNQLKPWYLVRQKKYFRILFHGQQVGFLAAVPIPATNSWYLLDLMRSPNSPLGATELLVIEAIDILKKEGANEVTIGTTPLAHPSEEERNHHPIVYRILSFMFENFDSVYGFKSLYQYKGKFGATHWGPQYLITSSRMPGFRTWYGLLRALFGRPISSVIVLGMIKSFKSLDFTSFLQQHLTPSIITRTPPKSFYSCVIRAKSVLALFVMNMLFFLFAVDRSTNELRPTVKGFFGYSWDGFSGTGFHLKNLTTLLLSSFLHFDLLHLFFNMLLLVVLVAFLELIAGSMLVVTCYFFGIMLSNPLTSVVLEGMLNVYPIIPLTRFSQAVDVGCSLGVFACLGALCHFLKNTVALLVVSVVLTILYAWLIHDILALNHILALLIGIAIAMKQFPKKMSVD